MDARPYTLALAVLAGLLGAGPARAQIHDAAKLFSPDAITRAEKKINTVRERSHKGLLFDTFAKVPPERAKPFNLADPAHRDEMFRKWADELAHKANLDGIQVLVCMEPQYILVRPYPESNDSWFGKHTQHLLRAKLVSRLQPDSEQQSVFMGVVNKFRQPRYDDGLRLAVDWLERYQPVDNRHWAWALASIAALLSGWAVLSLARSRLLARDAAHPERTGFDDHGVELSVAVLGGVSGAIAGGWLFRGGRTDEGARPTVRLNVHDLPSGEPATTARQEADQGGT